MKQDSKIITKYKNGTLAEGFLDSVKNADEDDLRVLLAAILLEEKEGEIDTETLCKGIGIEVSELSASVKFWRGAGLLGMSKKTARNDTLANKVSVEDAKDKENKNVKEIQEIESAHRDGKVERDSTPSYSTEQLTELMEKRRITADFISEASRVYGKIFNQHEVEIIVRMIDYVGFDEECVLMLLSFYSKEKKTLRYIEKAALALYDEGIADAVILHNKLCAMERMKDSESKIRAMFGMSGRALTTKEKKYITSWVEKTTHNCSKSKEKHRKR